DHALSGRRRAAVPQHRHHRPRHDRRKQLDEAVARQARRRNLRARHQRAAGRAAASARRGHAPRRRQHAGGGNVARARPQFAVRHPFPPRHQGPLDAQQGQPPGRTVRPPDRNRQGRSGMSAATNFIALGTVVRREVMRITRIWTQTLIPPAITMTLYFIIFGKVIGSRIGVIEGGFTYMQYIVPGLVMMSIIMNSYGNITSSFFGAKFGHYVEEMLVSPMPNWVILSGYILGGMIRGLCVGAVVLLIATLFTPIHMAHPLVMISTAVLGSIVFALAGFVNAVFAKNFDDIALIPNFVLTPLIYLGGVFYSVKDIGEPWRALSLADPILYMINGFRYGMLGITDVSLWATYGVMVLFIIV